jgi:hypothetical protein
LGKRPEALNVHARYTLILRLFLLFALSSSAIAADPAEGKAIAVARAATLNYCTTQTPCTFQASRYGEGWLVLVEFTKRDSPDAAPMHYPGGHEGLILDKNFKITKVMPGE